MTGLEIAIVGGVVGFVVVGIITIGGMVIERYLRSIALGRVPFELTTSSLRATRQVVLVGQNTDITYFFRVNNPRGLQLSYDGRVTVQDIADVPSQQNTFATNTFSTEVKRLHCKWSSVGRKRVTANLNVHGNGKALTAFAEGFIEVVAKLEEPN